MRHLRAALLAVVARAVSAAAVNSCSASTTTLSNAAVASSLAKSCSTFTGDVAVATSASGSLSLNGLQEIQGSLLIENNKQLTDISSDSLETITDALRVNTVQVVNTLNFPQLQSVQSLSLEGLPNAPGLPFLQTLRKVSVLSIQNTQIHELEGFNLRTIKDVVIANNAYLETINLQPYDITGQLVLVANGADLDVSMPNVASAHSLSFSNCTSISMPSLKQVDGSLSITSNYITAFDNAPLLKEVDGGLKFTDNTEMIRISLPELRTIGLNFDMLNNTNLHSLDRLYTLQNVYGSMKLEGTFTDISLPSLETVAGSFVVESSKSLSCDRFDELYRNGVLQGDYKCSTAIDSAVYAKSGSGGTPSTATSGSGEATQVSTPQKGLSAGAKAGIGVGVGVAGLLLLAVLAYLLWKRRRARKPKPAEQVPEKDGTEVDRAAMLSQEAQKHELQQPPGEMPLGREAQELPAKHGHSELGKEVSTTSPESVEERHEMPANETSSMLTPDATDDVKYNERIT